jgi:hypothetical protein
MDVHDVGDYKVADEWRVLETGMVTTVEPGIYIPNKRNVPKRFRNIGIRIEDDVAVTTKGPVVIAGGGMIGTSLALALAPLGLCVAVVEAVARKAPGQPSFDDRSTALSRSTQRMFEAMGLWPEIVAASTPIRGIHVSDQGRFGFSHIDAREQGVEALGTYCRPGVGAGSCGGDRGGCRRRDAGFDLRPDGRC